MDKSVRGFVDGFEGGFVSGWAICDADANKACQVKVLDPDGTVIGEGQASRSREGLRRVGKGRTDIAFRIAIDFPPDNQLLRVVADDQPLDGSPIAVGRGMFDGNFIVEAGVIRCLVTERALGIAAPTFRFEDHFGRTVAEGPGSFAEDQNQGRPTLVRADLPIHPHCFGFEELELRAYANNVYFAKGKWPVRLDGFLDELSSERCSGWLLSPDAPLQRFEIEVLRNGERVASGRCELPREDLKERYPLIWRAGFNLELKKAGFESGSTLIAIRLAGGDFELFNGPFLLSDRSDFMVAARRAAAKVRSDSRYSPEERNAVEQAITDLVNKRRFGPPRLRDALKSPSRISFGPRRFNIVIPIFGGVEITRACIESVLATVDPVRDVLVLVDDVSPEPGMARVIADYSGHSHVLVLRNEKNSGFIASVNRALSFCRTGHVVLLNSDTRVFSGAWDEMERLLESDPAIGTITAISNKATIFSYPLRSTGDAESLPDVSWEELAEAAMMANAGRVVDVPTGHGFCMLIRRDVADRVGLLDTRFGRGYGEENDFCIRAADLGWRNVAACGIFVEHHEGVSFLGDKKALLAANMPQLNSLYPEYLPSVMSFEREDPLRIARWSLDAFRLKKAVSAGSNYMLIVQNWLEGGTKKAIADLDKVYGCGGCTQITLSCRIDGMRELDVKDPPIRAVFSPQEDEALFAILNDANVNMVNVHQLLGYTSQFVQYLTRWGAARSMKFYMHDFYAICPRVTMINSIDKFCGAADVETCERCITLGGGHEASRMNRLSATEHRTLFRSFMISCCHRSAPSIDSARWVHRVFPDVPVDAEPHPQNGLIFPGKIRDGDPNQLILLGAIGPHKGSRTLLDLAKQARLLHPNLLFHVIGYTDLDDKLRRLGNVTITGKYEQRELSQLVAQTNGFIALFLHEWPETYSYTLSEAWALGLWPAVPNIGAPAERVQESGVGEVFSEPASFLAGVHLKDPAKLIDTWQKGRNH